MIGVRLLCASLLSAILGIATGAVAQETLPKQVPVPNRDYIVGRIAELRRIATPEGIEALEQVDVGDSKQWISIRGLNRANPVLLMIHGGPGSPTMATSWAFQTPWEDYFTVVQWDQRGIGKNYAGENHETVGKTMTADRMVSDAEAVVAYLRKRLNKDKIVVLGFSWGTEIGTLLAQRRPEWLYAYVGVGQAVNDDAEAYIYKRSLELARRANNKQAIAELEALAPYPLPSDPKEFLRKALLLRKVGPRIQWGMVWSYQLRPVFLTA